MNSSETNSQMSNGLPLTMLYLVEPTPITAPSLDPVESATKQHVRVTVII